MLKVENVSKYYKDKLALKDFSISLEKSKAIGVIGVNGSGKTTFFKVLLNLLEKDSGFISFKGKSICSYPNALLGYLPEERSLYKDLTVYDQVMLLGRLKNIPDETIESNLNDLLKELNVKEYKNMTIGKLSKGNQQKIQIICALIHDPEIVILDEPLSGLDIVNVNLLKKLIHKLKKQGKYILLSSHQFEHIEEFCEDIIILKKGFTSFNGSIKSLINDSKTLYIRLSESLKDKYINEIDHIALSASGSFYNFEIANKEYAKKMFKIIVNKETPDNISLHNPSLASIVRENDYI